MVPSAFGIRQIVVVEKEKGFSCKTVRVFVTVVCVGMVLILND